ncbi:MAG TPA: hypothetical protein DEE98_02030 [Elusimicrobia bacterium]|nr:MAG: hypothetical protein A2278_05830 [Elusimicrobia bacterium RIFOXYA12_FULL_49_49]OGS07777.1 MAG: hypothetical protein A2204_02975 [Elusimicrobia bacterium RIFOXYA1_FULL_47_7]OGS09584.1 MAG: hypothetical protein A2386_07485 [Elusimicrobia bacterium RIFOXYB1_FULL_48_9]OGS15427.1 MAG: hypothetical protein A2251_07660 [Elusimicrobia bacterium RIFOXYA2_FULL_47_53]OGS30855.1 MAG: hypothetical protein A2323_00800 [Elusimicrobia bacterium RIFOXYB2_FULL_46_23]HBU69142.1 hypothetical protein [Elus
MNKTVFDWDPKKDEVNLSKHGISFFDAQFAFADPHRVILEDLEHSKDEKRYYCIGKVDKGIITVRFTYRGNIIRIIGAGYWRKGRSYYEEKNKLHK